MRVLSFDPGFKNLGIAVCEPGELLYAATESIGSMRAPLKMGKKLVDILEEIRIAHGPFDAVTFETPPYVRHMTVSCTIWHVMGAVTGWAANQAYPIWDIRPQTLKKHCCKVVGRSWHQKYQPKKSEIAVAVVQAYPTIHAAAESRDDHADDAALAADAYFAAKVCS